LRFPVQLVARPQGDAPRGYMGRLESGHALCGSEIVVLPSGRRSRIRRIVQHGSEREIAVAGDSVTLVLAHDTDIARGDLIADPHNPPREARALDLTLVWLGHEPLRPAGRYLLQQASRRTLARIGEVASRLDVNTLEERAPDGPVVMNDIVRARLAPQAPIYVDGYDEVRATGSMILIDEATNQTVAAGLVDC
jgi:sulfate adenylyltransferase subunit 1